MLVDDPREDELPDSGRPGGELLHVQRVHGQQPGQEVHGVALVDLPEDLVERAHDGEELRVVVAEALGAHVLGEHIGAGHQHQRLQVARLPVVPGLEFPQKDRHFLRGHHVDVVVLERGESGRAVGAGDAAASLLQRGPVAQGESWKNAYRLEGKKRSLVSRPDRAENGSSRGAWQRCKTVYLQPRDIISLSARWKPGRLIGRAW